MIFNIDVSVLVLIAWALFIIYCIKESVRPKNFPNGPVLLPFIGSKWSIPAKGLDHLYPKWKKKYGNLVGHKLFHKKLVVVCGTDEIIDGLKHPNFQGRFISTLLMQRTLNKPLGFFFADDETWSEVRRFTLRYFGTVFTSKLEAILRDELLEDFSTIRSGEVTDINGAFMKTPFNVIMRMVTGTRRKDHEAQIDHLQDTIERAFIVGRIYGIELIYPFFKGLFQNHVLVEAITSTHTFLRERLEEHRKIFNAMDIKDYTDAYVNEQEKELKTHGKFIHFTDEEFLSCGIDILHAGNESAGKTIAFILRSVAMNPQIQRKLHEEVDHVIGHQRYPTLKDRTNMPYLEATIYEGMRIDPIAPDGVIHRVTEDTYFKGYFFEKDSLLLFALSYAMRDPEKWKNPDEFMPERFLDDDCSKAKLPNFGLGKRSCIGEVLSKNFIFLYLTHFFQKFSIEIPKGYKPSMEPVLGFTNGPKPFRLIITKREDVKN